MNNSRNIAIQQNDKQGHDYLPTYRIVYDTKLIASCVASYKHKILQYKIN